MDAERRVVVIVSGSLAALLSARLPSGQTQGSFPLFRLLLLAAAGDVGPRSESGAHPVPSAASHVLPGPEPPGPCSGEERDLRSAAPAAGAQRPLQKPTSGLILQNKSF